ncbi:hypothetical protein SAMD00020551_0926 [Mesobacillus selenatarsenatis SF-1]|uniref:Uncharacterized protein n=1 Tax=Mesobacillus selenatarsenatis (strain DSM 18680 / JCM 14380 / FERM P-15431 / SF-1) TaxID=1321606 RepID=A0A0A8X3T4_MESS1|nr:hypothetical protein SAMD00020551_0926 [Mesobacillus selenatarsenatis SF-1]
MIRYTGQAVRSGLRKKGPSSVRFEGEEGKAVKNPLLL